ncbi:MAG TPA: NAD(P)/FAD-dependent oxidoreductase [Streptosporangiaceae bacterium]|nr:NAD(P)/FAD-dependent oxidoreductase [Streptosporangiaceae bacterium]
MRSTGMTLRVAVAGGGLGGLCLAQHLAAAGIDVVVYERDPSLDSRGQGYRIHLDARAGRALAASLPAGLYDLFARTCGQPSTGLTVLSERLRTLHTEPATIGPANPYAPGTLSTSANRRTLRQILACGLGERIRFGRQVTGYDQDADEVRIRFADGTQEPADLLVAADGVGSCIRRQYLPEADLVDSGSRCIYGRTPADRPTLASLPDSFRTGFTAVVGNQVGMAAAPLLFRMPPERAAAESGLDITLASVGDYMMWAVAAQRERWPVTDDEFDGLSPEHLHGTALAMIRKWHPSLRALVEQAVAEECFLARIQHSTPVAAWPSSRVTVLGDAIHAMSPARGSGGNTALRDAAELGRRLVAVASGEEKLLAAVGDYETVMREYGYEAIRVSAESERTTVARRTGVMFWLVNHLPQKR